MTTTTEASEALDRLREVVKPGDRLYVIERRARSGDTCRLRLWAIDRLSRLPARVGPAVAQILGLQAHPDDSVVVSGDYVLSEVLDRLSVALFGEPGQIKGEYL